MEKPKVTILCPIFNGSVFLEKNNHGIFNQSYENVEVLFVNDGSTDNSLAILYRLQEEYPFVKVLNLPRMGFAKALNEGLKVIKTDLVARQDIDDKSYPTRIEKQVEFMTSNLDVVWLGTAYDFISELRNEKYVVYPPQEHLQIVRSMAHSVPWAHTLIMFRKKAILDAGGFPEVNAMVDLELGIKLASKGYKLGNLKDNLGLHYAYNDSFWQKSFKSRKRQKQIQITQFKAIKALNLPFWMYIYPFGRYFYHMFPNKLKAFLRRDIIKRNEKV